MSQPGSTDQARGSRFAARSQPWAVPGLRENALMRAENEFRIETIAPNDCDEQALGAFRRMVLRGGEVNPVTLPRLMGRAAALGFVRAGAELVGVGAIKAPNDFHGAKVFAKAGSLAVPSAFCHELGWICLMPAARGKRLAGPLAHALLTKLRGAADYATIRVDNAPMQASLRRL